MNGSGHYRREAKRRGKREREGGDAVVTAVTIQVILSVILVLLAAVARQADAGKYDVFRARFRTLATDPAESDKLRALFTGEGWESLFADAETLLGGVLERPADEPPAEDPPLLEIVTEPAAGDSADAFAYDYLAPEGMARLATEADAIRPAAMSYAGQGGRPVPADCTLTPVVLGAALLPPVTGVVTSGFAYRDHPVTGRSDFHNGMDIAAVEGTAVLAPLPGEVSETGWSDIYGNYLVLRHADSFETFYGHCSELTAKEGAAVRQGDPIALVGGTGLTTGTHLHFSVIVGGQFTDPYWVLRDCIRPVE